MSDTSQITNNVLFMVNIYILESCNVYTVINNV